MSKAEFSSVAFSHGSRELILTVAPNVKMADVEEPRRLYREARSEEIEMRPQMKTVTLVFVLLLSATASAHAQCIVADPTPTPLNVRTAPNGRIIGTLYNGQSVDIIDHATDERLQPWVYVSDPETKNPIGWVYRKYIVCKGQSRGESNIQAPFPREMSPRAYCRAVGTIDEPDSRYTGPKEPKELKEAAGLGADEVAIFAWRCMDSSVYVCGSGNSSICHKMTPYDNMAAIKNFCGNEPNAEQVPASDSNRFPASWSCRKGKPYLQGGDFRVDKRGFPVEYWKRLWD